MSTEDAPDPTADAKLARVVAARARLRERFEAEQRTTPSMADTTPQGTGPTNRHGMPELPVGQYLTQKWPVLDLGIKPELAASSWSLTIDGEVEHKTALDYARLEKLQVIEDVSDFHCVTTWSRLGIRWRGVRVSEVLALAEPRPSATHLMAHAADGYTTNLSLVEALKDDVLLVIDANGEPLPAEHGGPVRMITPQLYAWKGAKWITRLELMSADRPGFWEERGYSMTAYPWRNDRYR